MQDGIYVSHSTYEKARSCKALIIDGKRIMVEDVDIYPDDSLPDDYMVFVENGEISDLRTFTVED